MSRCCEWLLPRVVISACCGMHLRVVDCTFSSFPVLLISICFIDPHQESMVRIIVHHTIEKSEMICIGYLGPIA